MKMEIVKVEKFRGNDKFQHPRIYFWRDNYNPVGEILTGERYNKPYNFFRKYIPEALKMAEYPGGANNLKVKWSQKAGCSCPCSPGFIITNSIYYEDLHVTYRIVEE